LIPSPPRFEPMLAEGGWEPFDDDAWWFEPKLDGIRCLAELATGETRLRTRTGRDATEQYPELHMVHELVDQVNAVVDGEIVAFDDAGRPSFEALQQRMNLSGARTIARASKSTPVSLVVFDLVWLDGHDTTGLPLEQRRELLELIVEQDHRLQVTAHVAGDGVALSAQARELGLEGVMAKRIGSAYLPGRRSPDWRKIKLMNSQSCVVLGWTQGKGGRSGSFGALLVGAIADQELRWIGQVGSGFTDRMLQDLMAALEPLVRPDPAINDAKLAAVKGATFVEPRLVCEVRFLEMTKSTGKMRAPSFRGMRPDVPPEECVMEPLAGSRRASKSR
jgi:bifunctional non-homologous end joining protein LigD